MSALNSRVLIFTATYKEAGNIGRLIDEVRKVAPNADMLVIDDNSPDGTGDIVLDRARDWPNVKLLRRPRKLGIGSAHKCAMYYAMREGYDYLLTMDADFSHDPKYIPALLEKAGPDRFVTGSRYCAGGASDYTGYRKFVSQLGNIAARALLRLPLEEFTTYFRVFDVNSLRRVPFYKIQSEGYAFGVRIIYYLAKAGVSLHEIPIHFADRTHGQSKIPKFQIISSASDLAILGIRSLVGTAHPPEPAIDDPCVNCGDRYLSLKHHGSRKAAEAGQSIDVAAFRCTSVGTRNYPPVYKCLECGLEQVPPSLQPKDLIDKYEQVEDTTYLENIPVREKTFARLMDQITPFIDESVPGEGKTRSMLEIGSYCGLFLREAEKRGWKADGVELSSWAVDYARKAYGVSIHQGGLDKNRDVLQPAYDTVVSWDVLEHVPDPRGFIREAGQFLGKGGVFAFTTLDMSNWFPRYTGKSYPWLIDMHIQYFDEKCLEDMLAREGFKLITTAPYAHYAWIRYIYERGSRLFPPVIAKLMAPFGKLIPQNLMVPVAFGDIRLYVARKER